MVTPTTTRTDEAIQRDVLGEFSWLEWEEAQRVAWSAPGISMIDDRLRLAG